MAKCTHSQALELYGNNHSLAPRQLLTAALLAPFNLHVLYLGVVYSRAIAGADRGGRDSPKYQNAGWYYMFVTLKLLETSGESVPLAVGVVAATSASIVSSSSFATRMRILSVESMQKITPPTSA